MLILGFTAYPFISYFSIANQLPVLSSHYLAIMIGLLAVLKLHQHKPRHFALLGFIAISIILVGMAGHPQWIILPLPFVVLAFVALIFLSSLQDDRTPYITRMAQLIRKQVLDEKVKKYTRRVTIVWTVILVGLIIEMTSLALFASLEVWSYVVNFLNYLIIASVFIVEYVVRRIHLHHIPHKSFIQFIKKLLQANQTT